MVRYQLKELKQIFEYAKTVRKGVGLATAQLEMLKSIRADFRTAYRTIALAANEGAINVRFNDVKAEYLEICGKLNEIVNAKKSDNRVNVLLPKIKIPDFDGKACNWRAFKDIFDRVVHL